MHHVEIAFLVYLQSAVQSRGEDNIFWDFTAGV